MINGREPALSRGDKIYSTDYHVGDRISFTVWYVNYPDRIKPHRWHGIVHRIWAAKGSQTLVLVIPDKHPEWLVDVKLPHHVYERI